MFCFVWKMVLPIQRILFDIYYFPLSYSSPCKSHNCFEWMGNCCSSVSHRKQNEALVVLWQWFASILVWSSVFGSESSHWLHGVYLPHRKQSQWLTNWFLRWEWTTANSRKVSHFCEWLYEFERAQSFFSVSSGDSWWHWMSSEFTYSTLLW